MIAEAAAPLPSVVHTRRGAVVIELFVPFPYGDRIVSTLSLGPVRFDHVLRWGKGEFESTLELLVDISGEDEALLRALAYPDVDRVFAAFLNMMPEAIKEDVMAGRVPRVAPPDDPAELPAELPIEPAAEPPRSFFVEEPVGPADDDGAGFDVGDR